jgi:hypothetical protein
LMRWPADRESSRPTVRRASTSRRTVSRVGAVGEKSGHSD